MTHAERCPICLGSGKLSVNPMEGTACFDNREQCHGCFGRGWVEVSDPVITWTYPQNTIIRPDQGMY